MENRTQSSIWIRNDLYFLVKVKELNLSKWVNDTLSNFFAIENTDEILQKISEHKQIITALELRLADIRHNEVKDQVTNTIKEQSLDELRVNFKKRNSEYEYTDEDNIAWLNGPKNIIRCKNIGLTPVKILEKLKEEVL
jgi:hypothetical protein